MGIVVVCVIVVIGGVEGWEDGWICSIGEDWNIVCDLGIVL